MNRRRFLHLLGIAPVAAAAVLSTRPVDAAVELNVDGTSDRFCWNDVLEAAANGSRLEGCRAETIGSNSLGRKVLTLAPGSIYRLEPDEEVVVLSDGRSPWPTVVVQRKAAHANL